MVITTVIELSLIRNLLAQLPLLHVVVVIHVLFDHCVWELLAPEALADVYNAHPCILLLQQ